MYTFGRKYTPTPFPGGFIEEDVRKGLYNKKNTELLVYRLKVNNEAIYNFDRYVNKLKSERTHYDYKGAIGVYLNKDKFSNNGYVCSSFVYEVLNELKLIDENSIKDKYNWNVRPEDFKSLDNIEMVYEGKASNLINREVSYS